MDSQQRYEQEQWRKRHKELAPKRAIKLQESIRLLRNSRKQLEEFIAANFKRDELG